MATTVEVVLCWKLITLWLFNIAMENGSFIDGLPFIIYNIRWWFSIATLNNQRVSNIFSEQNLVRLIGKHTLDGAHKREMWTLV